jgi:hypothetical protein
MPITVKACPLIVICRPIAEGAMSNSVRHSRRLMMALGAATPGCSSPGEKSRPTDGVTPSTDR